MTRWTRLMAATTSLLIVAALLGATNTTAVGNEAPLNCGEAAVQRTLSNGAAWRMCARIHPVKGLVLEQIEFKPASGSREYAGYMRVLDELYLAQLNVPYDTGAEQFDDITSYGFGDFHLLPQDDKVCEGDLMQIEQTLTYTGSPVRRTIPGICLAEIKTGLATHSNEDMLGKGPQFTAQSSALAVSSLSKIAWYEYQQKVAFDDHGGIDVGLGATGDLAPDGAGGPYFSKTQSTGWPLGGPRTLDGDTTYAASHWHSAIWRADFGIGGSGEQFVEQWDYTSTDEGKDAPVTRGTATRKTSAFNAIAGEDHQSLSWWRVGNENSRNPDGHARSYEIVNQNRPNESIPVTQPIVTATNYRECEEYASRNTSLNAACDGDNVLDYVTGSSSDLTDPVLWINVGYHHIDRDEDQSPMPMHWQRFQLVPRDFFAQSPSITDARACINGASGDINSTERPCIATSVTRPRITAASTPVALGTMLTASNGLWVTNRTTWNYARMWLRDGQPIMRDVDGVPTPETGTTYVVEQDDLGHEITVKVAASQVGYVTGTAESKSLSIPGGPTPTPTPTTPSPTASPTTPRPTPTSTTQRRKSTVVAARTKTVRSKKRATLTVRVRSTGTVPSGKITIKRGSKSISGRLVNGVVKLKMPRVTKPGRYRFTIRYAGSTRVLPSSRTVILRVKK